jgi:hypothetical protein
MSINNTHYNLIDTLIFAMGKQSFGIFYGGWHSLDKQSVESFSTAYSVPMPVASVLVDCFEWADKNDWHPWL